MQKGQAIAYASRKLKSYEQNYPTHDLELVAIMRWVELLKDYDLTINDHPSKANKVADSLSRKDMGRVNLLALSAQQCLQKTIKLKQNHDPSIAKIKEQLQEGKVQEFQTDEKGIMWMKGCLCVPDLDEIR
ncbi:uncharacterized protein [Primulina huaijiensis]|uniref:uncharacterized protein n=1 Tax=Primulina huaijiensis TaxID=1492673 RepID=UPI003CC73196